MQADAQTQTLAERNDVLWDEVVRMSSIGQQDVYAVAVAGAHNLVAQGISVR